MMKLFQHLFGILTLNLYLRNSQSNKHTHMKKLIVLSASLFLVLSLSSCEELIEGPCNCGTVANDGLETSGGRVNYWLEVRNNCSQTKQKFYVDGDVWMDSSVGSEICFNNQSQW